MEDSIASLIATLLPLVPAQYAHYVAAAFTIIGTVSVVLAAVKPVLARYLPQRWREWTDGLITLLDKFGALNTPSMQQRLYKEQRKVKP